MVGWFPISRLFFPRSCVLVRAMKMNWRFAVIVGLTFAFLAGPVRQIVAEDGYSFKIHNTTKVAITKLLASEDGKDYGNFDIGGGIAPGKEMTLKWDKSTDEKGCNWFFKALFADGEESEAKKFDFCEDDVELEF